MNIETIPRFAEGETYESRGANSLAFFAGCCHIQDWFLRPR